MVHKTKNATRLGSALFTVVVLACVSLAPTGALTQDTGSERAAHTVEIIRSGIPHDAIYAIDFEGEKGIAVGAYGLMLETKDGGGSWTVVPPKTGLAVLGIAIQGDRQVVVGMQGLIMTRSGDADWQAVDSGIDARMMNVAVGKSGLTIAVGEFGFIGKSTDFGQTWKSITSFDWMSVNEDGYEPHLYDAVVMDDGTALVVGEFGLVLLSTDGGETWEAVNRAVQSVFDLHFAIDGSNTGYAVGQDGLVLKSTDSGRSWTAIDTGTEANLLGVWSGNGDVVIVGIRAMLRSEDDGETWSQMADLDIVRNWYQGIDAGVTEVKAEKGFLRQQIVYIGGYEGTIARVLDQ